MFYKYALFFQPYFENALKFKIWPQNKDLRFSIHKIAKTEKSHLKIKFALKTKILEFPQLKIFPKKRNLPLKHKCKIFPNKFAPNWKEICPK